jgi:hypothetical protein
MVGGRNGNIGSCGIDEEINKLPLGRVLSFFFMLEENFTTVKARGLCTVSSAFVCP